MIRGIMGLGLFLLAVNLCVVFGGPSLKNHMLEGKMLDIAVNRAMKSEPELRRDIKTYIDEKNIPLPAEDLVFRENGGGYTIAGHYTVHAKFLFYERTYEFFPASHESARLTKKKLPPRKHRR